jgi:hypothetical protein
MIYQHAARDRDKAIARALGELASKARSGLEGFECGGADRRSAGQITCRLVRQ